MFIKQSQCGYDLSGEQFARGSFLCVFSHNRYKWAEEHNTSWRDFPAELNGKLYACVRHCSLRQFGHWMTGTVNIGGQRVTVSGSYGADGLTMDYEKLSPAARAKLVEVPAGIAHAFWHPEHPGWNSAGSEATIMRQWAQETFRGGKR